MIEVDRSDLSKIKRKRSEIGSIGLLDIEPVKDEAVKRPRQKHGGKKQQPIIYSIDPRAKKYNQTPRDLVGSSLDHSGVTWLSDEDVSNV